MPADRRLPDGLDEEPVGWRDADARTPLDLFDDYRAARLALDVFAEQRFRPGRSGESSDAQSRALDEIKLEFARIRERFLSPRALQRAPVVGFGGRPNWFDPSQTRVSRIEPARRGLVKIHVSQPRNDILTNRYHVLMVDGIWKLDGLYEVIDDGGRSSWAGI